MHPSGWIAREGYNPVTVHPILAGAMVSQLDTSIRDCAALEQRSCDDFDVLLVVVGRVFGSEGKLRSGSDFSWKCLITGMSFTH